MNNIELNPHNLKKDRIVFIVLCIFFIILITIFSCELFHMIQDHKGKLVKEQTVIDNGIEKENIIPWQAEDITKDPSGKQIEITKAHGLLAIIGSFSSYHMVDWNKYRSQPNEYNCNWKQEYNQYINSNMRETFCVYWDDLMKAKNDFNKRISKEKTDLPENVLDGLDSFENGFEDVFVAIIKDYYLRAFQDKYNNIMGERGNYVMEIIKGSINNNPFDTDIWMIDN